MCLGFQTNFTECKKDAIFVASTDKNMNTQSTVVENRPDNDTSGAEFMTHDNETKNLVMKLFELKAIMKSKDSSRLKKELAKKKYNKMLNNILKGYK